MPIEWLANKFNTWLDKRIEERAHIAGRAMVEVAKAMVPVDTGLLKSRIYYTYMPSRKLLTLHADTFYSLYVEHGTYKMAPRPYLRPALLVAGPAFLTGVRTQVMGGMSVGINHKPMQILPRIRPQISRANQRFNVGIVRRTEASAVHMNRHNEPVRESGGRRRVVISRLNQLHKRRRAWN